MGQRNNQAFWNRIAERYAARAITDVAAYDAMLADATSRLHKTDRVLEIGCGTGGTAIHLAAGVAEYLATDFSAEMIRIAAAKPAPAHLTFTVSEAEHAFDTRPFDAVCAFNVLHLVDNLSDLLTQIHAHLRPGGLFISKTWCFADLPFRVRAMFPVLRTFGLFPAATSLTIAQVMQAIRDANFDIIEQRSFGAYRQNPYFVCRKPV